jgi:hypothetical protein
MQSSQSINIDRRLESSNSHILLVSPEKKNLTWDERLIIILRNQGTPVRERIERMARNVISSTSLRSFVIKTQTTDFVP